jgi:O-antigen/teichoic acid export membrane protein
LKAELKSIRNVLSSNILLILIGIIQTFILPSILGPLEYGYWSLYLLYVSYAGFLIFGFCDGFYLKYGGEKYEKIDKKLFSSYHWILVAYLLALLLVWILALNLLMPRGKRYLIFIFVGIGGVLACYRSYFVLLNQATARFDIYAKGNVIEKILILITAIFCTFLTNVSSYYIMAASIIGTLVTVLYFIYFSRDIVFSKPLVNKSVCLSAVDNIRIGFTLTLSGVGGMLMTGFGRFIVEKNLGIIELGYYSLMFSVSALFTQLIYAFSTVFFPIFRRLKEERAKSLLEDLDQLIINLGGIILILYYPARYFLEIIFPQYNPSMNPMLFLFPIILCQSRMTLVYNTLYKVLRFEKQLFKNVFVALIMCVIITLLLFNINKSKESVAFATYLAFLFWNSNAVHYYRKKERLKMKWITSDTILSAIYIYSNYLLGYSFHSFLVTLTTVLIVMVFNYKKTIRIVRDFKLSM